MKLADFSTQTIGDGQKAIEALADIHPAVVILDLYHRGASGDKVLAYIRDGALLEKIIVVLTTLILSWPIIYAKRAITSC